jgi:cytochrome c-type biogenesis protein CcsB
MTPITTSTDESINEFKLNSTSTVLLDKLTHTTGLLYYFKHKRISDYIFALFALSAAFYWFVVNTNMDIYDQSILVSVALSSVVLGWAWRPLQVLMAAVAVLSVSAVGLYAGQLNNAEHVFLLKYLLNSQRAIAFMGISFVLSLCAYWLGLLAHKPRVLWTGTALSWIAIGFGFLGLMMRWHESHLLGTDIGHIPVSNLYEVFILFALLTAAFYLYYEDKYQARTLGGFVMLVVVAAVVFLFWYSIDRQAHEIAPLVPALQSWWMKIHVPANFIGYGTFSVSAMVAFAYLVKHYAEQTQHSLRSSIVPLFVLGVLLLIAPVIFRKNIDTLALEWWFIYFGVSSLIVGGILLTRRRIAQALPAFEVLDDIMYKSIAVGFAFFTVATILGALWAADAWGTYWQWDPKETWALIVWLNYAAWLHLRFIKGMRGVIASYWALVGLLITSFAFLGVNMWLSGLHSYGAL